jgi:phage terminase Nu1 subunit (DNA packaging protein)
MELTKEQQVAQDYKAALDSVNLLNAGKPVEMTDADWLDCKQRNIDHLKIQIAKGAEYYGTLDLTPFENAVKG